MDARDLAIILYCQVLGRHLALPLEQYGSFSSFADANSIWIDRALELGDAAMRDALDNADLKPTDVSALFFVSVTGSCAATSVPGFAIPEARRS